MKTNELFKVAVCALLFTGIHNVQAQSAVEDESAEVSVSIELTADVISIDIPNVEDVEFVYSTPADYTTVKKVTLTDHFKVTSNRPYDVSVVAKSVFSKPNQNSVAVPLNVVNVKVAETTTVTATLKTVALDTSPSAATVLVEGAPAAINQSFDIEYSIPDATTLLNKDIGTYTTTITYTATHQ
jgi:hypothetical protein